MKKNLFFIVFFVLITGFAVLNTAAQDTPAPMENFVVFEEFVSPSDMVKFKETQSKTIELWKKHGFDLPVYCYLNDDNAYYWIIPIKNFASIDMIFEKSGELSQKMTEDGFDGQKAFRDLSTMRTSVIHWEKDLSYHPTGEYGQNPDKKYVEWTFCYMRSGHEKEAAGVIKKYIDFYESIPENYDWDVYSVVFGHDTPCYIIMKRAKSALALREKENALGSKYGDKFNELWSEFSTHVRKSEDKKGWFLSDWSINWQGED
jgi:hypothetical protein